MLAPALAAAPVLAAKKRKAVTTLNVSKTLNEPIPPRAPGPAGGGVYGLLTSTIEVGKRFRGRLIRDVDVTVQTLGTTGDTPANDLFAKLTAPNGATVTLFSQLIASAPNLSIGPLTIDDESPLWARPRPPVGLAPPWTGRARPAGPPLAVMDGGPAKGIWTLKVLDRGVTEDSTLVSWALQVSTGRPYATK